MKKIFPAFLIFCQLTVQAQINRMPAPVKITSLGADAVQSSLKTFQQGVTRNICYNFSYTPAMHDIVIDAATWGTSNREYLYLAYLDNGVGPNGTSYYAKIDTMGNVAWAYGIESTSTQFTVELTSIGKNYIAGVVTEGGYDKYVLLLKLGTNGAVTASYMYYDNDINSAYTQLFSPFCVNTPSGDYVVCGHKRSSGSFGVAMLKIDNIGLIQYDFITDCNIGQGLMAAKLLTNNVDIGALTDDGDLVIMNVGTGPYKHCPLFKRSLPGF